MIFERLTLHNFQRYDSTNTIEFPYPEETSLVVILAPNKTSKTTILRAIDIPRHGQQPPILF
jgi:predicted ATP-binding protein involved in virulence